MACTIIIGVWAKPFSYFRRGLRRIDARWYRRAAVCAQDAAAASLLGAREEKSPFRYVSLCLGDVFHRRALARLLRVP